MSGLRVVLMRETHLLDRISPEEAGLEPGRDCDWESLTWGREGKEREREEREAGRERGGGQLSY